MADRETFVTNAAESTLSSSLAQAATTVNVTSTAGFPDVPFYATIDPGNDSKREVVRATAKTATTLTVVRGEDGTSDVAHDLGASIAVVPVGALWTDINDRVEAHDHSGGTAGATIATGDLTGHDKAAHTALGLYDASNHTKANHDALALDHGSLSGLSDFTADHGTDHDSHDHSAAAATIAAGDLADHNKAVHDALDIDAATLDGNLPAAFAAVAGDTFTGAVTFEAGIQANEGSDILGEGHTYSSYPDGFSWMELNGTRTWGPGNAGASVYTFNFGDANRTWQLYVSGDPTQGDGLAFRTWSVGSAAWGDWQTVTTAENPGLWEVDNSATASSASVTGTSYATMASLTLAIPSDWGSWKCEAYAMFTGDLNDEATAVISIDGTDRTPMIVRDGGNGAVGGRRTGMTTTGNRTVSVRAKANAGGAGVTWLDTYIYARAVRTS